MPLDVQWPMPRAGRPSILWNIASHIAMPTAGALTKIFAALCSHSKFYNVDRIISAIDNRPKNVPLITACNHHSCIDDPFVWSMLPLRLLMQNEKMRWVLAAHDICFTCELHSRLFALGQNIPVVRGDGVYQQAMNYCIELLNLGKWVHLYPEGKVNVNPEEFLRLKWGIGRLIADTEICPIVIPFWHLGMDSVLPNVEPYRLKLGKVVTINVGKPIDFSKMKREMQIANVGTCAQRKALTDKIQPVFAKLRVETEELHKKHLRERAKT